MLRAIRNTAIALAVIGAALLVLSRLALALRGRALSLVEMAAAGAVLLITVGAAWVRKRRHTRRKYLNMRDSALW